MAGTCFGNLITNFDAQRFGGLRSGHFVLKAGRRRVTRRVAAFAEAPPGELVLLQGSSGFFEIAVNQASAAWRSGCAGGAELLLDWSPAHGGSTEVGEPG
jgi:S-adenosylmethionine hydrolase